MSTDRRVGWSSIRANAKSDYVQTSLGQRGELPAGDGETIPTDTAA